MRLLAMITNSFDLRHTDSGFTGGDLTALLFLRNLDVNYSYFVTSNRKKKYI